MIIKQYYTHIKSTLILIFLIIWFKNYKLGNTKRLIIVIYFYFQLVLNQYNFIF